MENHKNNLKTKSKGVYKLTYVYIFALFLIALFTVASQVTVQYFLRGQDDDGRVINIAGRQRMLSQKITKQALLIFQNETEVEFKKDISSLRNTLQIWESSHLALLDGHDSLSLSKNTSNQDLKILFLEIQPYQEKIAKAASEILLLDFQGHQKHEELLKIIINNEASFLRIMNDIVLQFELESRKKVSNLKLIETWLMIVTLSLLLIEGLFIFRPFTRNIQNYIKEINIKNAELSKKQQELEYNNAKLHQTQEELQTQRDFVVNQNVHLTKVNEQMSFSINYAESIQKAMLSYGQKFEDFFTDYFIINRPRDIVSGDFYWLSEVENKIILVVADCTGHGVQAGFTTLIGGNLLDKIVEFEKITQPNLILENLHKGIQHFLKQKYTHNDIGMDAIVVVLEKSEEQTTIAFAGAKNNLLVMTDDELLTLKGTRKSIGGIQNADIHFECQEVTLQKNAMIYLGSDGFEDQNNIERKKFGRKRIQELVKKVYNLPLSEQLQKFEDTLNIHLQGTNQRDDILWMGIKI